MKSPSLGSRIRAVREQYGLNQHGLACLVGKRAGRAPTVVEWESRKPPGKGVLLEIAALSEDPLSVTSYLMDGGELPRVNLRDEVLQEVLEIEARTKRSLRLKTGVLSLAELSGRRGTRQQWPASTTMTGGKYRRKKAVSEGSERSEAEGEGGVVESAPNLPAELEWVMAAPNVDSRTERMAGLVARAVAAAIHETLAKDELAKTREGQIAIADGLDYLAMAWTKERLDVSGLVAVASLLRKGIL